MEFGADPNAGPARRAKPLVACASLVHETAQDEAVAVCELLLKAGADEQDGADDNEAEEDEEEEEKVVDILDRYLSTDVDYGLDDHADVVRNPILMYQVKLAKEAERLEKRRAALIAEGFDEDEVGGPPSVIMDEDSGFRGLLDEPAATEDGFPPAGVDGGRSPQRALRGLSASGQRRQRAGVERRGCHGCQQARPRDRTRASHGDAGRSLCALLHDAGRVALGV